MPIEKIYIYYATGFVALIIVSIAALLFGQVQGQPQERCTISNLYFKDVSIIDYVVCQTPHGERECLVFKDRGGNLGVSCNWSGASAPASRITPVAPSPREFPREPEKEVVKEVEVVSPVAYAAIGIGIILVLISGVLFTRRRR